MISTFIPPPQLLQGEEGWKQKTFQMDCKGWNLCFVWPRRNVQSTSLASQQLETQKWRAWKLFTFGGNVKGALERWGRLGKKSSLCFSFLLQLSNPAVLFPQRNARIKPKTHRKKHPTVMVCMDTINAKAFEQGCAHLIGFNPKPCKSDGKPPKNFKEFGIKALYLWLSKLGMLEGVSAEPSPA